MFTDGVRDRFVGKPRSPYNMRTHLVPTTYLCCGSALAYNGWYTLRYVLLYDKSSDDTHSHCMHIRHWRRWLQPSRRVRCRLSVTDNSRVNLSKRRRSCRRYIMYCLPSDSHTIKRTQNARRVWHLGGVPVAGVRGHSAVGLRP